MATRAYIGILLNPNRVKAIYSHFDGYVLNGVGETLHLHYNSLDLAQKLIAMGDASAIGKTIEDSVFYYRDRKEPWENTKPTDYSVEEFEDDNEILYLFKENQWFVRIYDSKVFQPVDAILSRGY